MGSAADIATSREERPAHVTFERVAVQDPAASLREGRYVARDVDYVNVTPSYSKDCFRSKASIWLERVEQNVKAGRTPERWLEVWREAYDRWKNKQEIPLNGVPIKGWGVISPAQQEMLIKMNCLTVEDLADVTEEGLQRLGFGGVDLKNKARGWLQSMKDHGALTMEVAALKQENMNLQTQLSTLMDQIMQLQIQLATATPNVGAEASTAGAGIGLEDILE